MSIVKPFKGVRPPVEFVAEVASRPYDVLNSEEARKEAGDNDKSLYHIIRPEIDFEPGTDEHDPKVYAKAVENFKKFQDNGWLVQDCLLVLHRQLEDSVIPVFVFPAFELFFCIFKHFYLFLSSFGIQMM